MTVTRLDAARRATVWVDSAKQWGTLLWVAPVSLKVKVRLVNGAHVVVPSTDVELHEGAA